MTFLRVWSTGFAEDIGDTWPLIHSDMWAVVKDNYGKLINFLDVDDEFIDTLQPVNCLSDRQLSKIRLIASVDSRNEELLDMLKRSGVEQFKQFVDCVRKRQVHVVPLLIRDTGKLFSHRYALILLLTEILLAAVTEWYTQITLGLNHPT